MNRPLYESKTDRAREQQVAKLLAKRFDCEAHKLPISYGVDFMLFRTSFAHSILEVKVRDYSFSTIDNFGGLYLSLSKWMRARRIAEEIRSPFMLALQCTAGDLRLAQWSPWEWPAYSVEWGGRSDRDDWQDKEPVVLIPGMAFVRVQ